MCVIFLGLETFPRYKLVIAANRDEFYARPTAQADFWQENPNILAGKDLLYGGTWHGITKNGRFAALTNYRDPNQKIGNISRGNLVKDFLQDNESATDFLQKLRRQKNDYTGFNLIFGTLKNDVELFWYSNVNDSFAELKKGIYGLSNRFLDTAWHKVESGKKAFQDLPQIIDTNQLFKILSDRTLAENEDLPDTGIGFEKEKLISPIFIASPDYGTRSSTVVLLENDGKINFTERTFNKNPFEFDEKTFSFQIH